MVNEAGAWCGKERDRLAPGLGQENAPGVIRIETALRASPPQIREGPGEDRTMGAGMAKPQPGRDAVPTAKSGQADEPVLTIARNRRAAACTSTRETPGAP